MEVDVAVALMLLILQILISGIFGFLPAVYIFVRHLFRMYIYHHDSGLYLERYEKVR